MRDLTGKVAFITGGANGIGVGIVRAFLSEGMKVVIADWNSDDLLTLNARMTEDGTMDLWTAREGGPVAMSAQAQWK